MNTKTFLIISIALFFVTAITFADLQNTFASGGIAISGSFSASNTRQGDFTKTIYDNTSNAVISVAPSVALFIIDYANIAFSPYFQKTQNWSYIGTNLNDIETMNIGGNFIFQYYFVFSSEDNGGFVPSIGLSAGMDVKPGLSSTINGVDTENKSLSLAATVGGILNLNWFITDKIAFTLNIGCGLKIPFYEKDINGNEISIDVSQLIEVDPSLSIGISFYIPYQDQILIKF